MHQKSHKRNRRVRRFRRLRQLRREREWTQDDVARQVDLTSVAISLIERGRQEPSLQQATRIAELFGEPVERVFEYVEVPA